MSVSSLSVHKLVGSMNFFLYKKQGRNKSKIQTLKGIKVPRKHVGRAISKFFCNQIPFNVIESPKYEPIVNVVADASPGVKATNTLGNLQ